MQKTRNFASAVIKFAALMSVFDVSNQVLAAENATQIDPATSQASPTPLEHGVFGPRWDVVVGAGITFKPAYEGGEELEIGGLPLVSIGYNDWLHLDPGGLSASIYKKRGFNLEGRLGYESGRSEDDGDLLAGLGDVDFGLTAGVKTGYEWEAFQIYAIVDKTIGGSEGLTGRIGAGYRWHGGEKLVVGTTVEATLADENYMDSYFGIDAAQSAASGRPQYSAQAGLLRADLDVTATYFFDEHWLIRASAGLGVLVGDAADSPVVEDDLQPKASLSLGYRF